MESAAARPDRPAVRHRSSTVTYEQLWLLVQAAAGGLQANGLRRFDRAAVYLPKTVETVAAMFGTSLAGGAFVPINPLLKPHQVGHILRDCTASVLVTSSSRAAELQSTLESCPDLQTLVVIDDFDDAAREHGHFRRISWQALISSNPREVPARTIDSDMVAIFYTSGSTGKPKGVVLSHRNMVAGAESVSHYLGNVPEDKLLAVLPFSFDYGFSQASTAFRVGASVVLMDYLMPRDVIRAVTEERITGLAGVPPLWAQLAALHWPETVTDHLRYITNSGGAMPRATLEKLRAALPRTRPFLMYGLTEAFRSTFLPPEEIDRRPDSIGKAIPNAEVLVVRPDGTPCEPDEPGELVHRGALVSLGYWNDPQKTAERFRPLPAQLSGLPMPEIAVWSGDTVRRDAEGYLYFIGRRDEMIKTSGYRVSPTEIEEVVVGTGLVREAVALGVPDAALGQAIVVIATPAEEGAEDTEGLLAACRRDLPNFMVPAHVQWRLSIPRNANGKYDRAQLAVEAKNLFSSDR